MRRSQIHLLRVMAMRFDGNAPAPLVETLRKFAQELDLTDTTGVHVEMRRYPVYKLAATKALMHLNRLLECEAGTRPPRFCSIAHGDLACCENRLNAESGHGTMKR